MKKLLILLIAITIFSCNEEAKPTYVLINGTVENSPSNTVKIFGNDFESELEISEDGTFSDTLKINKNDYYTLRIGRESSPVYLVQGTSLGITLDAKEFDETLVYSGEAASMQKNLMKLWFIVEKQPQKTII